MRSIHDPVSSPVAARETAVCLSVTRTSSKARCQPQPPQPLKSCRQQDASLRSASNSTRAALRRLGGALVLVALSHLRSHLFLNRARIPPTSRSNGWRLRSIPLQCCRHLLSSVVVYRSSSGRQLSACGSSSLSRRPISSQPRRLLLLSLRSRSRPIYADGSKQCFGTALHASRVLV